MNTIINGTEWLSDWMAKISAILLGLMTVLILAEIFLWNVFTKTTLIADEYCAYGLAAIIFLGAGYCLKEKGHIRITLVLGFLPEYLSRTTTWIATVITTFFMGYLWWIPQTIMLIGAAGFFVQLVGMCFKTFQAISKAEDVV